MAKTPTPGRPPRLTDDLRDRLCNIISRGHHPGTACASIGLHESTYYRWMQEGEDHLKVVGGERVLVRAKPRQKEFREAVLKAKAQAAMVHMEAIRDAAFELVTAPTGQAQVKAKNWTASAWFLERTDPERYGRQLVELSGRNGKPIESKTEHSGTVKVVRFGGRFKPDGSQTSAKP